MKQTFNPDELRKKASEFQKLAKKYYSLAKAIEKSGLYGEQGSPSKNGQSHRRGHRSAAWRKQQSERLRKYWAEKRRKVKAAK